MKTHSFCWELIRLFILTNLILISCSLKSQFQATIGYPVPINENASGVLITNQGNFVILADQTGNSSGISNSLGDIEMIELNSLGYLISPSKMIGTDSIETADWFEKTVCGTGGYIIAGTRRNGLRNNDISVTLTDNNYNPIWTRIIGDVNANENSACIKEDGNGDFILVGTREFNGDNFIQAVKMDCAGNQIWNKIYTLPVSIVATSVTEFATRSTACANLPNEYYITGAAVDINGNDQMLILSVNAANGILSWMNTYDIAPNAAEYGSCIQGSCLYNSALNGELWVAGYSSELTNGRIQIFVMKTDIKGNLLWANNYEIVGDVELAANLEFSNSGDLLITGRAESLVSPPRPATRSGECFLMKLRNDGNQIYWTRIYDQGFASQGNRIATLSNNEYFITGYSYNSDPPTGFEFNVLALKTDSLGRTSSTCSHNPVADIIKRSAVSTRAIPTVTSAMNITPIAFIAKTYQDTQSFCFVSPRPKCDSLFTFLNQKVDTSQPTCCFNLNVDNVTPNCFTQIQLDLSSGSFINVSPNSNWSMNTNVDQILVGHTSGFVPTGSLNPGSFCVVGAVNPFTVTVSYLYSSNGVVGKCEERFVLNCPAKPFQSCNCPSGNLPGANQVQNGDFSLGNTGFVSTYAFVPSPVGLGPGKYSIRNSTNLVNTAWACTDHTTGSPLGNFLIGDGTYTANTTVWRSFVNVQNGNQYSFCAFVNNLVDSLNNFTNPTLQLWINSTLQASVTLPEKPDVWINLSANWTSSLSGAIPIEIRLGAPVSGTGSGCDFAIDDIAFHQCFRDTIMFNPDTCCTNCSRNNSAWQTVSNQFFIQDMVVYDGKLILGGVFNIGGFSNLAAWDGTNFFPLGSGANGAVEALEVHNGKLYVGGSFSNIGMNIAEWSGTIPGGSWNPNFPGVSGGSFTRVASLLSTMSGLVAGGSFQNPANNIAIWNGSKWNNLGGSGISVPTTKGSGVNALGLFNGKIVAGGVFSLPLKNIAILNNNFWTNLGNGIDLFSGNVGEGVKTILQFGPGKLAVGGRFMEAVNAIPVSGTEFITQWDGVNWSSMNTGVNTSFEGIYDLKIHCGDLYACGLFTQIGGNNISGVAHWDDVLNIWKPVSNHANRLMRALVNYKVDSNSTCDLFAAGENILNHLKCITATNELEKNIFTIYPNPTNSNLFIELDQPAKSDYTINVIDLFGKTVLKEILETREQHAVLKMIHIPKGLYLIEVKDKNLNAWYRRVVKE